MINIYRNRLYIAVSADMNRRSDLQSSIPLEGLLGDHIEHLVRQALPGAALTTCRAARRHSGKVESPIFQHQSVRSGWEAVVRARNLCCLCSRRFSRAQLELIIFAAEAPEPFDFNKASGDQRRSSLSEFACRRGFRQGFILNESLQRFAVLWISRHTKKSDAPSGFSVAFHIEGILCLKRIGRWIPEAFSRRCRTTTPSEGMRARANPEEAAPPRRYRRPIPAQQPFQGERSFDGEAWRRTVKVFWAPDLPLDANEAVGKRCDLKAFKQLAPAFRFFATADVSCLHAAQTLEGQLLATRNATSNPFHPLQIHSRSGVRTVGRRDRCPW